MGAGDPGTGDAAGVSDAPSGVGDASVQTPLWGSCVGSGPVAKVGLEADLATYAPNERAETSWILPGGGTLYVQLVAGRGVYLDGLHEGPVDLSLPAEQGFETCGACVRLSVDAIEMFQAVSGTLTVTDLEVANPTTGTLSLEFRDVDLHQLEMVDPAAWTWGPLEGGCRAFLDTLTLSSLTLTPSEG